MKHIIRNISLSFTFAAMAGCFPYFGYPQKEIPQTPRTFIDSKTGQTIEQVLVVPRFTSSDGISSGAGHGPERMTSKMFVAHPFTYQTGTLFPVPQTRSIGIMLGFGWGWMGWTNNTDGVLVIAPGYKSLWVWDLWGDFDHFKHVLTPLSTEEAAHELEALQSLLDKKLIEGPEDERRWSVGNGLTIHIHLSDNDKSVIRTFLSSTSFKTRE